MEKCLLVMDMQHEFKDGTLFCDMVNDNFISKVKKLIDYVRKNSIEVIYTQHLIKKDFSNKEKYEDDPCYCIEGTKGSEIFDEVKPLENEKIFRKHRISALYKTDLEKYFKSKCYEEIIVCGVMTNCCVRQTTLELQNRDFHVIVIEDCCATTDEKTHNFTIEDIQNIVTGVDVIKLEEFIK